MSILMNNFIEKDFMMKLSSKHLDRHIVMYIYEIFDKHVLSAVDDYSAYHTQKSLISFELYNLQKMYNLVFEFQTRIKTLNYNQHVKMFSYI